MNTDILEVLIKDVSFILVSCFAVYTASTTFLKNKREDRSVFLNNQDAQRAHSEKLANDNMKTLFKALYHEESSDLIKRVEQINTTALDNIKNILKLYK